MKSLVFIALIALQQCLSAQEQRPNFLMIAVDDLNHYTSPLLQQPGHFLAKVYPTVETRQDLGQRLTPNLDRLAKQSLTFAYAFAPQPLCGPSRTAALTGIPPHISGYTEHSRHFRQNPALANVITLPEYLRQNGYETIGLGKIFHKPSTQITDGVLQDWPDMRYSWDHWIERPMGMSGPDHKGRTVSPYSPENGLLTFGVTKTPVEKSWDYLNTKFAAELYSKGSAQIEDLHGVTRTYSLPQDAPFLLAIGLFAPHLPFNAPQQFYDRFPTIEMTGIDETLIDWVGEDILDIPELAQQKFINDDFDKVMAAGERQGSRVEAWRRSVQAYLAAVAYADHCLGQLVDAIENSPHRDNTVIALFGDHGWQLGDKRRYRKAAPWEAATHTTLIIRDPRRPASTQGQVCDHLVSLQNLYPTFAKLAGLPIPEHVHGRDMTSLLDDPTSPFQESVLITNPDNAQTLRTPLWRYTTYSDGSEELYHMKADPYENTNLASDVSYINPLKSARNALKKALALKPADYRN